MSRAASLRVLASPAQLRAVPWPPRIFSQADSPISSLPQLRQTSSQLGCRSEAVAYHSACSRTLSRNPHRPAILRVSAPMAPAQSTAAVQAQVAQSPADAAAAPPTEKPDVSASKDVPRQQLRKLEELTWENTFVEETPGDTNTENNVRIVRKRQSFPRRFFQRKPSDFQTSQRRTLSGFASCTSFSQSLADKRHKDSKL